MSCVVNPVFPDNSPLRKRIMIDFVPGYCDEYKIQKNSILLKQKSLVNIFTATYVQLNASMLNKGVLKIYLTLTPNF